MSNLTQGGIFKPRELLRGRGLKQDLGNFDMLDTLSFGVSTVGLFCCGKYEETPNEKMSNMSKLTESYFSQIFSVKMFMDGGGRGGGGVKNIQKSVHVVYG